MFEIFNGIFIQFTEFAKGNPVVSGIVSLWGLGVITFLFREVPAHVWEVIVKQFTVRVTINCKDDAFYNIIKWYEKSGLSKQARTLRLNNGQHGESDSSVILSAGYGNHYFTFRGRPFRLTREKEEKGGQYQIRESIEIVTIGRSQKPILDLLSASDPRINSLELTKVHKWVEDYWQYINDQVVRSFDSVILEANVRQNLLTHLENFKSDKDWYLKHCIPYRTGICLYGPPGTGKTSLVKSICGIDGRELFVLNLNAITDSGLEAAIDSIDKNAVVLIEDIDSFKATNKREESKNKSKAKKSDPVLSSLTLSGILNAIDGISASNGRILIITTNKIEHLDDALMRPGRIDLTLKLDYLTEETTKEAFHRFYPSFKLPEFRLKERVSPAEFQNLVMQFKDNPEEVLKKISLQGISNFVAL